MRLDASYNMCLKLGSTCIFFSYLVFFFSSRKPAKTTFVSVGTQYLIKKKYIGTWYQIVAGDETSPWSPHLHPRDNYLLKYALVLSAILNLVISAALNPDNVCVRRHPVLHKNTSYMVPNCSWRRDESVEPSFACMELLFIGMMLSQCRRPAAPVAPFGL
jgi:hypothetical protein